MTIKIDLNKKEAQEKERIKRLLAQQYSKTQKEKSSVHEPIFGLLTPEQRIDPLKAQKEMRDEWE